MASEPGGARLFATPNFEVGVVFDLGRFLEKVKTKLRDFGRLTPIAIVTAVVPMIGSSALLLFGYPIGHWLQANPGTGAVMFVIGVFFFCGLAMLPTNLIGILAGWAFGFWFG